METQRMDIRSIHKIVKQFLTVFADLSDNRNTHSLEFCLPLNMANLTT